MNPSTIPLHRWLPLMAAMILSTGCTWSADAPGGIDYESARSRPPLDVPPDLVAPRPDDRFRLPGAAQQTTASGFERARQQGEGVRSASGVLPTVDGAKLVREGSDRWLHVDRPPEQVWPLVREFWQENGFIIASESPEVGILETDWAENRAKIDDGIVRRTLGRVLDTLYSTGERDRYRTRIERSPEGGTDVFVTHRGMEEVYVDQREEDTRWQPRPTDPDLEVEFLRRLMLRFGADQATSVAAAQSLREAPAVPVEPLARLDTSGDTAVLKVREGFDRAWRQVGLALDRTGFTVEDRDRSQGTYFVRYLDPAVAEANKPGFFGRVFSGAEPLRPPQYRIVVAEAAGDRAEVTVKPREAESLAPEDRDTARQMLTVIQEQMQR